MHITDRTIAIQIAEHIEDSNKVITALMVIQKLTKRRWQVIYSSKLHDSIHAGDKVVAEILQLLKKTKKNKASSISNIIRYIKSESKDYKKTFAVITTDASTGKNIESALDKDFANGVVHTKESETIGVLVSGEWLYYKRTLDGDLNKLLQQA